MLELFIHIGFLEIKAIDLLDIFLVGLLIYQVYRLLRGSLAFNIFIGLLLVYLVFFVVRALEMELLSGILGQFIEVGVIALLIVFQPEIRKFLLLLGSESSFSQTFFWRRFMRGKITESEKTHPYINEIVGTLKNLQTDNLGAIIVLTDTSKLQFYANTGVEIDANISRRLLESIFQKNSPLHDGAVIIAKSRIVAAGCVLPVSDNPDLPSHIGLRHKAAAGITEETDAIALIVSEERGAISYARNGRLIMDISTDEVTTLLTKFFERQG